MVDGCEKLSRFTMKDKDMKTDTQWSRFQVFLQEADGKPHQDVGSVHATDPELALLNARDVFARRPACISMWVVPVEAIFSKTAEELEGWQLNDEMKKVGPADTYYIFNKQRSASAQTLVGTVNASSPEMALATALEMHTGDRMPFAWWVVSYKFITMSDFKDKSSFYDPAVDKGFRMSTDFKTHTAMRKIRQKKGKEV